MLLLCLSPDANPVTLLVVLFRGKRVTDMRVPKLRRKKVKGHEY